jgi:hypothetical protein
LWSALAAIGLAQFVKVPLYFIAHKRLNLALLFSTGGMPSSHSAAVAALSTAVAIEEGLGSTYFAISVIISTIVMFDAAGIRRHAGTHAVVINRLVEDFNALIEEMKDWKVKENREKEDKLKELLGHQPSEVFIGMWLGIGVAFLLSAWYK